MNHVSFSEEYYVADGRAKEVDAWASARICLGLAMPLVTVEHKMHFE